MDIQVLIERLSDMKYVEAVLFEQLTTQSTSIFLSKEERDIIIESLKKYAGIA